MQVALEELSGAGGLTSLAFKVFGRYLDKQEQTSDWQQRPLTDKQIR
jgi:ribonuclease D